MKPVDGHASRQSSAPDWSARCSPATSGVAATAVDVYERRPDPRSTEAERGRSINLALSERGLDALRRIDLVDSVMAPALPMHGRMMHGIDSKADLPVVLRLRRPGDQLDRPRRPQRDPARRRRGDAGGHAPLRDETGRVRPRLEHTDLRGRRHRQRADIVLVRRRLRQRRPPGPRDSWTRQRGHGHGGLRLQGAGHPGPRRRVRDGTRRPAHLATRRIDDDRAAQPGPLVHLHAVLAQDRRRAGSTPWARRTRSSSTSPPSIPTPCR